VIAPHLGELCLRSPHSQFVTGTTATGEQAIILPVAGMMHAYWFDGEGDYLRQEAREVSPWSLDRPYEERLRDRASSLGAWVKELALTPGPIRVKHFSTGDSPTLSIRDYPISWDDAEWGEGESLEGMLEWWRGLGAFVLLCDEVEHNIDREGKRFQ
jgi:hypothetical protein